MKNVRKLFALLVLVAICITLLSAQTYAASESDLTFYKHAGGGYYVDKCNGSATGSLTIPSTYNGAPVTHIDNNAFEYCSGLTSITLPDTMVYIEEFAFYDCSSLTSIYIPEGVIGIAKAAFKDCSSLTSITIPSTMDRICSGMFNYCRKLTDVNLPDGLTHIESIAFQYCTSLTGIALPDTLCDIGDWAFDGCSKLASIDIPDGVWSIKQYTFNNCSRLTRISIPDSVSKIGHHAFSGCSSLTEVIYCGTEEQWNKISIDGHNENLTQATLRYHDWVGTGSQKTCTVCKLTSDGHEHIWRDATCTTPKTCAVCALTEGSVAEHSYNAGVVTKPATCKEEGVKTRTCTVCNATKTEKIGKLTTHTYDNACDTVCNVCAQTRTVTHDYQAAWTSDSTYHWHKCSVCSNKSDTALHVPGAAATETTPQTCSICGYVIAPALGAQDTKPTTPPATKPTTPPTTVPDTQPNTQPDTQPNTQPDTQPSTPPTTALGTQPSTEPATLPSASTETVPEQSASAPGISIVQMLLIMLAEATILTIVFIAIWKKKR